jgi:hypothetical protein
VLEKMKNVGQSIRRKAVSGTQMNLESFFGKGSQLTHMLTMSLDCECFSGGKPEEAQGS